MNLLKSAYLSENFKKDFFSVHVLFRVWKFLQGLKEREIGYWRHIERCISKNRTEHSTEQSDNQ